VKRPPAADASPVVRWIDRPLGSAGVESDAGDATDRAAALFRRAEPVPALGPAALARVSHRMRGRASAARNRTRGRAIASALLSSAVVIFGAGGLVLAAKGLVRLAAHEAETAPGSVAGGGTTSSPRSGAGPRPAPPAIAKPAPPAPADPAALGADPPPPAPEVVRPPLRERVLAPPPPPPEAARAAPPAPVLEGPQLAGPSPDPALDAELAETQLLASALRKLRRDRDPAEALRVLDEHRARFPSGALTAEATVARIDALLALGRRHAALEVLDGLSLTGYSRRRELLVLRGELQTEAGNCADALLDLDLCARVPAGDQIEERAVYGKAVCLARLGQRTEASTTLQGYLRRFPRGRFVKPALESLLEERR
jgi:hypothetical protein